MNPHELLDHIRSGSAELVLRAPLRFPGQTSSTPYAFNELVQALQSSETIRSVDCYSHQQLGITEDEWVRLVKTLGVIKDVQRLRLNCKHGSHGFHPFRAIADAVKNAHSLHSLKVYAVGDSRQDQSGAVALAIALRERTALEYFTWFDFCSLQQAQRNTSLDPVLQALSACPHLRKVCIMTKCASADAVRKLLHLPTIANLYLVLNKEHWLAVANEIQHGRNEIRGLLALVVFEGTSSAATEAVKVIAGAIRRDHSLVGLELRMENGFTDEAGVNLAEALIVNKTLRKVVLADAFDRTIVVRNKATLGAQAYEAFSAVLRVNTSLTLELPPLDTAGGDQRLVDSYDQLRIEQRLNAVGRGKLLTLTQTTKVAWVDALQNVANVDDTPAFQASCRYSLLRLKPSAWMLQLKHDTSNSGF
jgi:hypothetical protein